MSDLCDAPTCRCESPCRHYGGGEPELEQVTVYECCQGALNLSLSAYVCFYCGDRMPAPVSGRLKQCPKRQEYEAEWMRDEDDPP